MRGVVLKAAIVATGLVLPIAGAAPDPEAVPSYRYVLTSARANLATDAFAISQRDLPELKTGAWSVRKTALHGGKQEGAELITIDNGRLRIALIPTRGMSILEVRSGDLRLGWDSPVKEVVHPQYVDLQTRGGLGWLEGFNEAMVRCGLEFAGHPGRDEFLDNTGAKAEMDLTLHGKIGNIPASEVEVVVDRAPPYRIHVIGTVHERSFYGPKLELRTERELPSLTIWKNTAAVADGYVTGLEPGVGFPFNRKVERQAGRLPKLAPGETRRFGLDFGLHVGSAAVADATRRIESIRGGREPRVETKPPLGH